MAALERELFSCLSWKTEQTLLPAVDSYMTSISTLSQTRYRNPGFIQTVRWIWPKLANHLHTNKKRVQESGNKWQQSPWSTAVCKALSLCASVSILARLVYSPILCNEDKFCFGPEPCCSLRQFQMPLSVSCSLVSMSGLCHHA